ncbi:MAG: DoxX family membrane protein [Bacteroidota bacterium]
MNRISSIVAIVARLFLGGMMVLGSFEKFKPSPTPQEVAAKAQKFTDPEKEEILEKVLYISGMKQTGYAWQVVGACELIFGLMLIFQFTALVGAILLIPVTFHIFAFHLFLEPDETGELILTGLLFAVNLFLILREAPRWKHLLWIHPLRKNTGGTTG